MTTTRSALPPPLNASANPFATRVIAMIRLPDGSSRSATGARRPADPTESRRAIRTTSAVVPTMISMPIATTATFKNRIPDPIFDCLSASFIPCPMPESPPASDRIRVLAPPEAAGQRADRFLADSIGSLSRTRVKALILAGHACRDEVPLSDPAEPVRAAACYTLTPPPPAQARPVPQTIPLTILHEDDSLIVLDKPAGLVVHPAPGNPDGTLVNALLAHAGDSFAGIGGVLRPGIVHRLDKDTSGVMVVAKTEAAEAALSGAFSGRTIERAYLALCWGVPALPSGQFSGAIGRDPRERKRMAVRAGGKPSLTRYRVVQSWFGALALLECRLGTGRTHQIRVHLAHAGHPLVGDPVYLRRIPAAARTLPEALRCACLDFPRQALHAARLGFRHPVNGLPLVFETGPPPDFAALLAALDQDGR
jgi:23S rRNA pseudouridine1911/1915/1917 synthase